MSPARSAGSTPASWDRASDRFCSIPTRRFRPALRPPGLYADSGHLLYVRDRVLMARRFDAASRAVTGEPIKIADTVDYNPPGQAAFAIARSVLVYRPRQHLALGSLMWIDRAVTAVGGRRIPAAFRHCRCRPTGASPPSSGATRRACRRCGRSNWRPAPRCACRLNIGAVRRCGAATDRCWLTASPPTRRRISSSVPIAEPAPNGASRNRHHALRVGVHAGCANHPVPRDSRATPVGISSLWRSTAARRRSDCCKRRRTRTK